MQYKLKNRITVQFSMASLTDIVFLLLIFSLLITQFTQVTGVPVNLPVSSNTDLQTAQVNITINAHLEHYIEDQKVNVKDLKAILSTKFTGDKRVILLHMDKTVPVAYMIHIADIGNQLNATVSVATELQNHAK